ncbi:hypothetical protein H8E77_25925 [bacterium]|nr:hypothetical protein [bacterium]
MIPKGIIIILFSTYFLTIGAVFIVFFMTRKWISDSPDVSNRLIRAIWIICITITIVFGGLATGIITLLVLKDVGFF